MAYTLAVGRRPLAHRAAVVARDHSAATAALRSLAGAPVPAGPATEAAGPVPPATEAAGPVPPATGHAVPVPADGPPDLAAQAFEWLRGGEVGPAAGRRVPLPGYPFQRDRHWIEPPDVARLAGSRP